MRLCFSIVTAIEPEILLMDEWLSVGDLHFIDKAQQRIKSLIDHSSIVVLGSHNLDLLEKTCNKVIYLKNGSIIDFDASKKVIQAYRRDNGC